MNQIFTGDALDTLRTLPTESVHCIVTSPPYYALRDYGVDGQIGLEETPLAYIAKLVDVFREARRVLRADGTFWLNIGDSYATGGQRQTGRRDDGNAECSTSRLGAHQQGFPNNSGMGKCTNIHIDPNGFKPKDLMMIPARLAIALHDDGWYLRSDIIWAKPNPLPESVTDRPTRSHEYIFMLTKEPRYYYDAEAIKEPGKEWAGSAGTFARKQGKNTLLSIPGQSHASHREERDDRVPPGRNKRDVWTVASHPYPEAHFATMPPKLVESCILAGTSPRACEHCGSPWRQQTERTPMIIRNGPKAGGYGSRTTDGLSGTMVAPSETRTLGWQPTCTCKNNTGSAACVVFDPFMGAGTVALVALKHNRQYLGIELNPEYVKLTQKRLSLGPLWEEAEATV